MMNMTTKQIITLLLMTATMAVMLALLPEYPADSAQKPTTTQLVATQAAE